MLHSNELYHIWYNHECDMLLYDTVLYNTMQYVLFNCIMFYCIQKYLLAGISANVLTNEWVFTILTYLDWLGGVPMVFKQFGRSRLILGMIDLGTGYIGFCTIIIHLWSVSKEILQVFQWLSTIDQLFLMILTDCGLDRCGHLYFQDCDTFWECIQDSIAFLKWMFHCSAILNGFDRL